MKKLLMSASMIGVLASFSAAHAAKDSGIANTMAGIAGMSAPLSRATETQYRRMIELGLGGLDKSGIAELTFPNRSANAIPK
jgi:3-hydroxyisobutyrate dehydrogenase-like beta-hydroxyacid dehydrogenase